MMHPRRELRLAEAAGFLGRQLRLQLFKLAETLQPHADRLERRFQNRLRRKGWDTRRIKAMSAITPGAAARLKEEGRPVRVFFEQVEYSGRRLAKLDVAPGEVIRALRDYDLMLDALLKRVQPAGEADVAWVREQLHFSIVLTLNNAYFQVRRQEAQAFYDLFRAEVEAKSLNQLLHRFLRVLLTTLNADAGRLLLFEDSQEVPGPLRRMLSRPRYIERGSSAEKLILDPGLRALHESFWSIPLRAGKSLAGVMQFAFCTRYQWLPRELDLLEAAGDRCLAAAEKTRLMESLKIREAQVRRLSEHMIAVEEEERRRISAELHDEAGQAMAWMRLQLEVLERDLPLGSALRVRAAEIRATAERTILEIRRILAALSPAVLQQMGLPAAVRQLAGRFQQTCPARVKLSIGARIGRLPKEIEAVAYRLVQESLNNIARHSSASAVNLSLDSADGFLELKVEDNGIGFDLEVAARKRDSFGLAGMRERVTLLGGDLLIDSGPRRGTRIRARLPVAR
ncbi:MAG: sensor histidine kinase [Bryobacterales bacterium]|nr:sensor histidine kinase [Bryobacterales bacterium]